MASVTRASAERPSRPAIPVLTAIVLSVLSLAGACAHYGFAGSLPAHLETIRIEPFRSRVQEYGLEQELTSLVTERIVMDGRLAVVTGEQDSELEAVVAAWSRSPYSYTSSEQVEEYRLEIRVELTFADLVEESDILDAESVTAWIVYDPSAESEQDARRRLLQEMAEEIVRRCLSGW